jgi:cell division protein FtsL
MSASAARAPARRPKAAQRELKVVRRKKKGLIRRSASSKSAPIFVAGVVLVIATISVVLFEQVMLAQTAFKVQQMRQQMVKAEARHAELVLQAARLGSSARIEKVAIHELGMTHPEEIQYVVANIRTGDPRLAKGDPQPVLPPSHAAASFGGDSP